MIKGEFMKKKKSLKMVISHKITFVSKMTSLLKK